MGLRTVSISSSKAQLAAPYQDTMGREPIMMKKMMQMNMKVQVAQGLQAGLVPIPFSVSH